MFVFLPGSFSNRIFQGVLTKEEDAISWEELTPLPQRRVGQIVFRFKDNIIIAGGAVRQGMDQNTKSSLLYNINNKTWSDGPELPFPLRQASSVVSEEQNLALIIGGYCSDNFRPGKPFNGVITFDLENGFQEAKIPSMPGEGEQSDFMSATKIM